MSCPASAGLARILCPQPNLRHNTCCHQKTTSNSWCGDVSVLVLAARSRLVRAIEIYASPRPYLREAADSFKSLIAANNPVEELPVTPTELGEAIARQLGLSKRILPQAVNEALGQLGLQEKKSRISRKTGKEKHEWVASEAGKPYGEILVTAIKGTGDTKFQLRWFASKVLPLLLPLFQKEDT